MEIGSVGPNSLAALMVITLTAVEVVEVEVPGVEVVVVLEQPLITSAANIINKMAMIPNLFTTVTTSFIKTLESTNFIPESTINPPPLTGIFYVIIRTKPFL
jgi:hypothetical protein